MKEHRTKALRVTTTNAITSRKDDNDLFGTLLQLELACLPSSADVTSSVSSSSSSKSSSNSYCRLCHRRHHQYKPPDGATTVLLECSSCRNLPTFKFSDSDTFKFKRDSSLLSSNCSCPPCPLVSKLTSRSNGLSPLHALFAGDTLESWDDILEQVRLIVETPQWLSCTDGEGNTPLLAGGRKLLKLGEFDKAAELAAILLQAGSLPDASNAEGRTLLAYSVSHMDETINLSRLLINAGASVWPNTADSNSEQTAPSNDTPSTSSAEPASTQSPVDSIFTAYLRAIMRKRKLDEACFQTLSLIAQAMGEQPSRMHMHVMRTMFDHARCVRVLGPVFLQMKLSMSQHWGQPQSLQTLCRTAFRRHALRSKVPLNRPSLEQHGLPLPVQKFVLYELTN